VNGTSRAVDVSRLAIARLLAVACALLPAHAPAAASVEQIALAVTHASEHHAAVTGELRIPDSFRDHLPAVVIVNSSPGFDGRGAFYADALNQAGIATLEIDMFQGRGLPLSPVLNMPHVYQSLQYLARHPRIDPARVGMMGLSWGAQVAMLTSSVELARRYSDRNLRFAAHRALYPQCWVILTARNGKGKLLKRAPFNQVTGSPVHILAGDKDVYDDPDGCLKFVASPPGSGRPHFSITVYEGATSAWACLRSSSRRFSEYPSGRFRSGNKVGGRHRAPRAHCAWSPPGTRKRFWK
jgi:uncharacterized protein